MPEKENQEPASGKPESETILLEPVQLVFRTSAKAMAKALTEYSQHLLEVVRQLQNQTPGQVFRIQIVHRYPRQHSEVTHRVNGKGGTVYHVMDCNGGNGGGNGGE